MLARLYFYPRSPCGERRNYGFLWPSRLRFLSTLSLRRATAGVPAHCKAISYFYPRSPCGERPFEKFEGVMVTKISIHALLAESDIDEIQLEFNSLISIHALLAESDAFPRFFIRSSNDFYPRSPCGERPPNLSSISERL